MSSLPHRLEWISYVLLIPLAIRAPESPTAFPESERAKISSPATGVAGLFAQFRNFIRDERHHKATGHGPPLGQDGNSQQRKTNSPSQGIWDWQGLSGVWVFLTQSDTKLSRPYATSAGRQHSGANAETRPKIITPPVVHIPRNAQPSQDDC